jgi:hypothetical protein
MGKTTYTRKLSPKPSEAKYGQILIFDCLPLIRFAPSEAKPDRLDPDFFTLIAAFLPF